VADGSADTERARDAIARGAWAEAHTVLVGLDPSLLEPSDLEALADAAWWVGNEEESLGARHHAYAAWAGIGDDLRASAQATRLAIEHFQRGEPAVGAGWLARSRRHLEGQPEGVERGFLAVVEATIARFSGRLEDARVLAAEAAELGTRFGDRDLWALGIHTSGLIDIAAGEIDEGVALLDEAMTAVLAGELRPYFTGIVYCNVIGACLGLGDVGRAGEWSDAAKVWCESIPPESRFPALCRTNRAQVASLRGAWQEAEEEAERAAGELHPVDPRASARACYEAGEIRRRIGDLAGAERWFARAREAGFDPQPGSSLLRLAESRAADARAALRGSSPPDDASPLDRARLLAARVEVALAVADPGEARAAAAELDGLAARYPAPALHATSLSANGSIALAEDAPAEGADRFRRAATAWQDLRLPYKAARARVGLGLALRALGNEEGSDFELRAALGAFERLGAGPDADHLREMIAAAPALPRGLTAREAEVLRLVAAGRSNRQIAEELVISQHTVARHLQNLFAKLDVSSRAAATAFAFKHDLA
jgi:DNA-binding CsgD family transcriptional regulator